MKKDISFRAIFPAAIGGFGGLLLAGCVAQQPVEKPAELERLDRSLYQAAESFEKRRDYAAAVSYYRNLYQRNDKDIAAVVGLARSLRHLQQAREAQAIVLRALKLAPKNHDLRSELGKVQLALGEPLKAVDTLSRVDAELEAKRWDILVAMAIAHDRIGMYEQAERRYRQALSVSPENAVVMNNFALSMAQAGRLDEAVEFLERAAALPEATPRMRQNLALLYAMKGDLAAAEQYVRRDMPPNIADHNMAYYRQLRTGEGGDVVPAPPAKPASTGAKMSGKQEKLPPAEVVAKEVLPAKRADKTVAPKPTKKEASTTQETAGKEPEAEEAKSSKIEDSNGGSTDIERQPKMTAAPKVPDAGEEPEAKMVQNGTPKAPAEGAQALASQDDAKDDDRPSTATALTAGGDQTGMPQPAKSPETGDKEENATPGIAVASEPDSKGNDGEQRTAQSAIELAARLAAAERTEKAENGQERAAQSPIEAAAKLAAAAPPKTAAEANPKVEAAADPAAGGFRLQLGSFRSMQGAEDMRDKIVAAHSDLLAKVELIIESVDVPERGVFYRINSQAVPRRDMVDETCLKLAIRDVPCLLMPVP